jgi:hypothetical protein
MSDGKVRESTKTGRSRAYGITEQAKKILEEQNRFDRRNNGMDRVLRSVQSVFMRPDGKPYTWKSLTCWWRSATKKAGITINLYNGIRHSLGCQLMDQDVTIFGVDVIHIDLITTPGKLRDAWMEWMENKQTKEGL